MRRHGLILLVVWTLLALSAEGTSGSDAEQPIRIANGLIAVEYDPSAGTFSALRGDRSFIVGATFGDFLDTKEAQTEVTELDDAKQIVFEHPSGRMAALMLRDQDPWVHVKTMIKNPAAEPLEIKEIVPLVAPLQLDRAPQELRTLAYDGLAPGGEPKTAYLFLAIADPVKRNGAVCAWLTHQRASGLVRYSAENDSPRLEAVSEYGRLVVPAGEATVGETLAIGCFDDTSLGLEQYAGQLALLHGITVRPAPSGYMTWYDAGASDEKRIATLAKWCAEHFKQAGLDFLQIDDGWQLSSRDFSDFNPAGPYPAGMKAAAESIRSQGFQAGIWLTPFGWDHTRPVFADHEDWFVHRADGSVYEVTWAGDSLDMSHPDAREFLHTTISRLTNDWGFQLLKLDGLWAGLAAKMLYPEPQYRPDDFGDAVFHDPNVTNVEAYRLGLKTVRKAAGPDVYLLGCTVAHNMRTLGASIGLVDGMRIGIDSEQKWETMVENVKVATSTWFLHGRVWHNDPDVVYLDESLTLDQVRTWASWVAVTGQMYMLSNWLPDVPADRLDAVRCTIPNHNRSARPLDVWRAFPAEVWYLSDPASKRHILAMFNWSAKEKTVEVDLSQLVPNGSAEDRYVGFDFWEGETIDSIAGVLGARLRPHACHVIALRPACDRPQVVSTSRHVTQGIVDLAAEAWDPTNDSLVGVARVVGGQPYEMRIAVPDAAIKADLVGISPADKEAGVTTSGKQEGLWVRVTIESPETREVSWQIGFKR